MMKNLSSILLIDDDKNTNILNKLVIAKVSSNLNVTVAVDGEQALDMLHDFTIQDKLPDLILLDINMPEINGWEVLDHYKIRQHKEPNTNIVMLSSSSNPSDKLKIKEYSSIKHFEQKPLTIDKFLNIIQYLQLKP